MDNQAGSLDGCHDDASDPRETSIGAYKNCKTMTDGRVPGGVEHGEGGKFEPKYDDEDVIEALVEAHPEPLTVGDAVEYPGWSDTTAHNRLHELHDDGYPGLETKKVAANARVWWVNPERMDRPDT